MIEVVKFFMEILLEVNLAWKLNCLTERISTQYHQYEGAA